MELLDRIIFIIDRKYLLYINGYRESEVTSKKIHCRPMARKEVFYANFRFKDYA